ncbi:hypothetical protein ACTXMW_08915 [Brachybacterium paraconglomeratum]|uniref:hypothetical protein n=1 Tax=Brachybacterium paraconglomeratum TaxID=173362 RepID=UPI003FD517EF
MNRSACRPVVALAGVTALLALVLSGCTADPEGEDRSPGVTAESPADEDGADSPSDDAESADPTSAEPSAEEGTEEPEPAPAGDPSDAPSDEEPADGDEGSGWTPPADPEAEGPTAAPELPEVQGSVDEAIELPTGVVVSLTGITTTSLEAETPGEYSGPAVVVTVQVVNDSSTAQDVGSAAVSLNAEDGEVGVPTGASPYAPLEGRLAAGETVEGTYVFMLDPASGRTVTVRVNHSAGEPVAVFTGQTR